MPRPRLFLIDSFGFIFRAYHARARTGAPPMRNAAGLSTEAIYIFHNMVRKLVADYQPEYIAAIYESDGPTLREQEFDKYKANREPTPDDLLAQIPWIEKILEARRIPVLKYDGYEADDVIGTIANAVTHDQGLDVVIVSSDKDMLQLVNEHVKMLNPMKDYTLYDAAKVEEYMGVAPRQVAHLLALKGDAVDNIPGAPGIGDKGAKDLITRFGSVQNAMERAAEVERKSYRESLQNHRDQILLSLKLATIETAVPIAWNLEALAAQEPDMARLREMYRELEFFSLLEQTAGEAKKIETPAAEAVPEDFGAFLSVEEARPWLDAVTPGALVAIEYNDGVAVSTAPGVARSLPREGVEAWLTDAARPKAFHDWKAAGVETAGPIHDVMLYAFLLLADPGDVDLKALSERFLKQSLGDSMEARAAAIYRLAELLSRQVDEQGFREIHDTLDWPLLGVLRKMEREGIRVDTGRLKTLGTRMDQEVQKLVREIHGMAGREFNVSSPQQLAVVLYDEMKVPAPVKTGKGKVKSTAADILEGLAEEYPIVEKVLEYRQLTKLKGTYVDALPSLIDPGTGRLHTTFNPTGAATGRLSSVNPNLQNIPIRTELGREIRSAFVPRSGWKLVTADYSQIELRLLAHFSHDPLLTDSFRRGEDIHTRTASEVFDVPPLMVTPDLRRNAKAVNFGIVYGQTAFGLAKQLGIGRGEADRYIKSYFERYAGVKKYIEKTIQEVRQTGVSQTLYGRKRPIPDILSRNPNARGFAERTAVNTPLQGTAADLIKAAMLRIDARLTAEKWQSRLLLQVHDELVFEAPAAEASDLAKMAKQEMESVKKLAVPLVVDTGIGDNWRDAK
jgi:DNA polymerase I